MQLVGDRFTDVSAAFGNDLATLPDYPAEIRAPAGTIAGVSSFQVHIAGRDIVTPGDAPNLLVAMNPAALKANINDLMPGGAIIANSDAFETRNLDKAGYLGNPLEDGSLAAYRLYSIPMTSLTLEAAKGTGAKPRDAERSKNFFALGLIAWMYTRPTEAITTWIAEKFGKNQIVHDANVAALKAGYNFGETAEIFEHAYTVPSAHLPAGRYRNITGNLATTYGLIAAGHQAKLPLFLASYPITPASDILHELSKHKRFGIRTVQAEDEISAAGMAIGAAYAGHLAVTTTSGPGVDLKSEAMGLAVSIELPLLLIDVQRGGPSTGLPTKTEQADLMLAMYGRHGEAPLPIVAAYSPSHCFDAVLEGARIALKYQTPVMILTDGYLANGSEPWLLPAAADLPDISVKFQTEVNGTGPDGEPKYMPYLRDPITLARPWAVPGTPGLMHRVGGIEKQDVTGNINYEPLNHEKMMHLRAAKIAGIANDIPPLAVDDPSGEAELLVLGWGSTWGAIQAGARRLRADGVNVAHAHLMHLNPFPANLGEVLSKYSKVLIPEMNLGQLSRLVRAEYLVDAKSLTKVQGLPFRAAEIEAKMLEMING
ncbi:MAG: 2-oxoacid:acceptor oxidoreductase subunit alpha [Actinobacteria bacterium]|nr:2-oxoacid:acceptor oxidoreductase subunit alpha [Actinomycetota bacterium]MSW04898.1 2-oxoacid:acceptor oxidoreductase subunit alpha [Actinomycetota bacterium]MSX31996.1 2-oxoacid:acceptor oxidoreductase subunit alpha [Actinomycetota bacterium]MSX81785.1 2-oxoacid:acceptor oxidoreductase subunit alpha [Actinomycetota bacterium]MSY06619.1 2-oxoacid:acceptor oxidoreductase subunit alpha [Actinomycetota bacterium]